MESSSLDLFCVNIRPARPVDIPIGRPSRSSESEGWSATRDLHPEGSAILRRRGLLFPQSLVAGSEIRVFGNVGHMHHAEAPKEFLHTVQEFLERAEARATRGRPRNRD